MRLYITRHGQTQWNTEGRLQGWMNSPLTPRGLKGAEQLRDELKGIDFDAIFTSDQYRAVKTAEIVAGDRDIEINKIMEFREIGFGQWEGMKLVDIKKKYAREFDNYMNKPMEYKSYGGESIDQLFERVEKGLQIVVDSGFENALIVAHGVTIKALVTVLKGLPRASISKLPVFPGTSLSIFHRIGEVWEVELEGDTSHFGN
ncbi:MAG: histidine phosphatase family protein [Gudongella sp.]|nr:histidine phosphatase family protein [Gudongella sp.]